MLFDILNGEPRSPCYRVRHDNPGETCDGHAELIALLHDCQVVIAGAVGDRLRRRLDACGIEVVATAEERPASVLVARHLAGTLTRADSAGDFTPSKEAFVPTI